MKKLFFVYLFLLSAKIVLAEELTPPPPPPLLQPPGAPSRPVPSEPHRPSPPVQPPRPTPPVPSARVLLKCDIDQFILDCQDRGYCNVGPGISASPVKVVLNQKSNGRLELVSNLNGDQRVIYTSSQAMNCDSPAYSCQSRNGQENLQIMQVPSSEYGTQDFTVVISDPSPWTAFSVGATAAIRCLIPRN